MKFTYAIAILAFSSSVFGTVLVGYDGKLFEVPNSSKTFPAKAIAKRVSDGKFVELRKLADEGYVIHKLSDAAILSAASVAKKASAPPTYTIPEGCGHHPMTWIPKSKVVATLPKPKADFYFEVPAGFTAAPTPDDLKTVVTKDLEAESSPEYLKACLENSKSFTHKNSTLTYFACAGDLNESLYIYEKTKSWKQVASFTTTDDCP